MGQALHAHGIPARPLTERDAELWRKAGSPSTFRVWSNDHYYTCDRSTSKWDSDASDARAGGAFFVQGTGRVLTLDEVQRLPDAYLDRERGFVIDYLIVRASGWTDAKPKPPAEPPF